MAILPNTTLAAIVRNEIMNPAGGIVSFVTAHVGLVEEMVVVDTGSTDGTRQVLEELQRTNPNLRVVDHRFHNYGDARNHALTAVKTPYTLVLDADELLLAEQLTKVRDTMATSTRKGRWNFANLRIAPSGVIFGIPPYSGTSSERLFPTENAKYKHKIWECVFHDDTAIELYDLHDIEPLPQILQFVQTVEAHTQKMRDFYTPMTEAFKQQDVATAVDQVFKKVYQEGLPTWKRYNPQRDKVPFGLAFDTSKTSIPARSSAQAPQH
jgi:glycosyltransferase involved in cell wall biosynthesis